MSSHESASISGWCDKALIDLAEYLNGMAFKPSDWTEEGAKIIRIEQLNNPTGKYDHFQGAFPEEHQIDDGDLIFSWSATLKVALWRHGPGVLNQHLFKVVPRHGTDKHFLYHLLDYYMEEIAAGSHGSTMRHIKRGELTTFRVSIPCNEAEQRKIAHILTTLDAVIERTQALIAKYEAIKQGLLHDLLTRGVDAQGRLRPSPADAPQLYRPSPLGWVPKEWEVVRLGQAVTDYGGFIQTGPFGSQLHAHEYVDDGVPVIMPQDITEGRVLLEKISYISPKKVQQLARHVVDVNDVVFARRGDLSRAAAIGAREAGWLCGTGSMLVRLPRSAINGQWLVLFYRHDLGQRQILSRAVGTTMVNLNSSLLSRLTIPLIGIDEQREIVERYECIERLIDSEKAHSDKLVLIKNGLMQDLLTGRVRVKVEQEN